jgi:hypothetical protein
MADIVTCSGLPPRVRSYPVEEPWMTRLTMAITGRRPSNDQGDTLVSPRDNNSQPESTHARTAHKGREHTPSPCFHAWTAQQGREHTHSLPSEAHCPAACCRRRQGFAAQPSTLNASLLSAGDPTVISFENPGLEPTGGEADSPSDSPRAGGPRQGRYTSELSKRFQVVRPQGLRVGSQECDFR